MLKSKIVASLFTPWQTKKIGKIRHGTAKKMRSKSKTVCIKEEIPLNNLLRKMPDQYQPIDYIAEQIDIFKEGRKLQQLNSISSKGFAKAIGKISNDYC